MPSSPVVQTAIVSMKKYLIGLFLLAVAVAAPPIKTSVMLVWDYPVSEVPSVVFNVYSSTNLSVPMSSWPFVTNSAVTNAIVGVSPGSTFWYVTASNEFGESGPSNTVTSTVPRNVGGVKVK